MSRRSRKNFRRCGSRITFSGTFPSNPYRGQMGIVGGITYIYVRAWHNEGTDYGDWGRPASLISLLAPNKAYTVKAVVKPKSANVVGNVVSLSGGAGASQMALLQYAAGGYFGTLVGSSMVSAISESLDFAMYCLTSTGTTHTICKNGVFGASAANGSETYDGNLFIGGRTDGSAANFEGDLLLVSMEDDSGNIISKFNSNNLSLWNGGTTAYDSAGNPITFTDNAPTGRTALVPVKYSDAIAWNIL